MLRAVYLLVTFVCVWSPLSAQTESSDAAILQSPSDSAGTTLDVTYVGNEGFLIELGNRKVLIDALYRTGVSGYVVHSPAVRSRVEGAKPPFDGVDLVLASHHHADHFHPASVGMHLVKNRPAVFVSTKQSVDQMASDFRGFRTVASRVHGVFPNEGEAESFEHNGVAIRALNLHHGRGRPIQNLGFLVEADGLSVLHVGDTEVTRDDMISYGLDSVEVDVFFVPYWFLAYDDFADVVTTVSARTLVAMHIPPPDDPRGYLSDLGGFEGAVARISARYPNAAIFAMPLEKRSF